MSKYILKFTKEKNIRYISHLDLLRLFQRSFKRAHIKLKYSQGFNPHARISFAQPLSLGYESFGEYLEFETQDEENPEKIWKELSSCMPDGLNILACKALPLQKETLAGITAYGKYTLTCESGFDFSRGKELFEEYLKQNEIIGQKRQKKTKKMVDVDIKPMIRACKVSIVRKDEPTFILQTIVKTGSNGNLNPEMIAESFCAFLSIDYIRHHWKYTRNELYYEKQQTGKLQERLEPLISLGTDSKKESI